MAREFEDYENLLHELVKVSPTMSIVGVEGFMTAGKTYLAKRLAGDLGCGLVETDNSSFKLLYPDRIQEDTKDHPYVECLDFTVLSKWVVDELDCNDLVIIEGICLRDVLTRLDREGDLYIYVKCVSHNSGLWHDGLNLEDYIRDPSRPERGVHWDELEYHARVRPHELADLVFVRVG